MIDWLLEHLVPWFVGIGILFIVLVVFVGLPAVIMSDMKCQNALKANGFSEADISAFTHATEFDSCNILNSSGTMAQFKKFLNGESLDSNFQHKKRQTTVIPIIIR